MLELWGKHETGWGTKWDNFTKFPASELDIDNLHLEGIDIHTAKLTINPNRREELSEDLIKLALIGKVTDYSIENLFLPYLPGARADKEPFNGSEFYSEFIMQQVPNAVIHMFDPHSDEAVSPYAYYPDSVVVYDPSTTIEEAVRRFIPYSYDAVIAPDKGAVERASGYANLAGIPCHYASKTRDPHTGKLTNYDVSSFIDTLPYGGKFLVVDDICDGGGTFKMLSSAITTRSDIISLDLWVSHGLFTGLASQLPLYYDQIMTTNSVVPAQDIGQHVLNIDQIFWKGITKNV